MKECIVAVVSLEVALSLFKQMEKDIVMMISEGNNEWTPPKVVKSAFDTFAKYQLNQDFGPSTCGQVQDSKLLLGLLMSINEWILQQ